MTCRAPKCLQCEKYHENDYSKFSCDVYPKRMPNEIIYNGKECKKEKVKKEIKK